MWFDARAKLAEIAAHSPAAATSDSAQFPATLPVSQEANAETAAPRVAVVASVATPPAEIPKTEYSANDVGQSEETFPHGVSFGGHPRTWTGRIVVLAEWRQLDEWDRHGSRGQHWNGLTRQWETPKGDKA